MRTRCLAIVCACALRDRNALHGRQHMGGLVDMVCLVRAQVSAWVGRRRRVVASAVGRMGARRRGRSGEIAERRVATSRSEGLISERRPQGHGYRPVSTVSRQEHTRPTPNVHMCVYCTPPFPFPALNALCCYLLEWTRVHLCRAHLCRHASFSRRACELPCLTPYTMCAVQNCVR